MPDDRLSAVEAVFLDARDLLDRLAVADARGMDEPGLAGTATEAADRARAAIADLATADRTGWDAEDRRAAEVMRRWAETPGDEDPLAGTDESWAATTERGEAALRGRIAAGYAAAQGAVDTGEVTMTRLGVLERLAVEPDPRRRRRLFLSLSPVWESIDGDGGVASPYRRMVEMWSDRPSPLDANARALGMDPAGIADELVAILTTWRDAAGGAEVEPWDWWYATGEAARVLRDRVPVPRMREVSDAWHAALGADPRELGVGFDLYPRPDRPPVPVAYTEFGSRPRRLPDGTHRPARAWVMAAYTGGGLGELTELVHETGHAIHVAAIDTRPAFADWPDSDAFTEALAELTALDTAEPGWQKRYLGSAAPEAVSLRGRYADVMLDICWALLEIRLHEDADRVASAEWAALTSTYLGIRPHPELSWWAMRGQLVDEPGYMVNYALGPILAADLRAAIRSARGDVTGGDPGWYPWVSERIYRFGLSRATGEVLAAVLGRAPDSRALLAEIARAAG